MNQTQILRSLMESMQTASRPKTSAYDTTATVRRIEDGIAWVHIPGGVDETPVKLTINAEPGDTVQVRVSGGTAFIVGNGTAPPTDDRTALRFGAIAKEALQTAKKNTKAIAKNVSNLKLVKSAVEEARAIADATNQHFWSDTSGIHVSSDEDDAEGEKNILMNSLGILLRHGTNIVSQFSASQVAFYDGSGNDDENVTAVFGSNGAQVGKTANSHLVFSENGMTGYGQDGAEYYDISASSSTIKTTDYENFTRYFQKNVERSIQLEHDPIYLTGISVQIVGRKDGYSSILPLTKGTGASDSIAYTTNEKTWTFSVTYNGKKDFSVTYVTGPDTAGVQAIVKLHLLLQNSAPAYSFGLEDDRYESGGYSFSAGYMSSAAGDYSFAAGNGTVADSPNQAVVGMYNVRDVGLYRFLVGGGDDDSSRKNLFAVAGDGELHLFAATSSDLYAALNSIGWLSEVAPT